MVSPIDKSFEDLSGSDWDPTDSLTDLTDDVRDKRSGREKRFKQPKVKRAKTNTKISQETTLPISDESFDPFD